MQNTETRERKPRADALRNRALILEVAQKHFLEHGVGTSLEAVAKEAGIGTGTLYRHFPTREDLVAGVLQLHAEELEVKRAQITSIADPDEALAQWLRAMEDYISAYNGLPGPLVAAAQEGHKDSPLSVPCTTNIETTNDLLAAAQKNGHARASVTGNDLFNVVASTAWLRSNCGVADVPVESMRDILTNGYNES